MKIKKRSIIFISLALLFVLALGGATMAWFHAETDPITNTFKAGTVEITLNDVFDNEAAKNVNPGDWYKKEVSVTSTGTKKTYVRVMLTPTWDNSSLTVDNVIMHLNKNDWVYGNDGWYYYKHILEKDATTPLLLSGVTFDGEKTDNKYQDAVFTIEVKAEAVQASHYAFRAIWNKPNTAMVPAAGVDEWTPVNVAPEE